MKEKEEGGKKGEKEKKGEGFFIVTASNMAPEQGREGILPTLVTSFWGGGWGRRKERTCVRSCATPRKKKMKKPLAIRSALIVSNRKKRKGRGGEEWRLCLEKSYQSVGSRAGEELFCVSALSFLILAAERERKKRGKMGKLLSALFSIRGRSGGHRG